MADKSGFSDGSDEDATVVGSDEDTLESSTHAEYKRKSSLVFDEYTFDNPLVDDDEDAHQKAAQAADQEAERFIQMARLKTTDYSKMDLVNMASAAGGLNVDQHLVDPVPIPRGTDERTKAVRTLYGNEASPDSEPFQNPIKSLELEESKDDNLDRVKSPPNLYEALQSNFLKSNYKSNIYRLFVLGSHDENLNNFIEYNKELVDLINVQSYTEPLNGVLCVYEYYYIHVLEGSEDNLLKLLSKYANDLEPSGYEWELKFHQKAMRYTGRSAQRFQTVQSWVLGIFKIPERQFTAWRGEKVFPNKMYYVDIPPGGFREKYFHFMKHCLTMVFTYNRLTPSSLLTPQQFNPIDHEEISPQIKKTFERAKIQRFKSLGKVVTPITFIQYVIDHKDNPKLKIRTVREHLELFGSTPPYISPSNTEWPPPGRIAPYY